MVVDKKSRKLSKLIFDHALSSYKVTARMSSVEVLEIFRADPDKFDAVIKNKAMPNMSGDKLAGKLIGIKSDIPVILCTGFSKGMPEEMAASLGIKGFLIKPVVKSEMAQMVRKVMDETKSNSQ
jgi:DNA-binding NtrC family response regulator